MPQAFIYKKKDPATWSACHILDSDFVDGVLCFDVCAGDVRCGDMELSDA